MKKTLLLGVLAIGMAFTSCGTGGASLKTDKDSVSYAAGTLVGRMAFELDSTLSVDAVVAGVRDYFGKKTKMTSEQAQAQIQIFMQAKSIEDAKAAHIQFTADSLKNSEAAVKYLAEKEKDGFTKTSTGLLYKIEKPGTEPKAQLGDTLSVNYKLTLTDGTVKDESKEPFTFTNEHGGMIAGFIEGMCLIGKGGRATLVIPAELGYGNVPSGVGPAQALTFDIEILDIKAAKK